MGLIIFIQNLISGTMFALYAVIKDFILLVVQVNKDIEKATDTDNSKHKTFADRMEEGGN